MSDDAVLRTLHADDLIELVEVLRRDHAAALADRDRLKSVVDAAQTYVYAVTEEQGCLTNEEAAAGPTPRRMEAWSCLFVALAALDASPTGEDT